MRFVLMGCAVLVAACGSGMNGGTGGGSGGSGGGTGGSGGGASGPHLSGLPDCGTPADGGTIDDFYDDVILPHNCWVGGCHGPGGGPSFLFEFTDAGTLRSAWVNVNSAQVPSVKRITPGDINKSYVLYKLWGQHLDAGYDGIGDRMPQGGPYLTDAEMCRIINWVNGGAR
jgi:hypothetical protein